MSLINDALKKAQKQRTGDSPPLSSLPGVGGEPAVIIAKREKPAGFNSQLTRLALGVGGVLLVIVLGGYFVVRSFHRSSAQEMAVTTAKTPETATATPKPDGNLSLPVAPPANSEPALALVPTGTVSAKIEAPSSLPDADTQHSAHSDASPSTKRSDESTPALKTTDGPAAAVKLDPKAIAYIENLRIAGIRASATDSKVLMNDRVYRAGDIVEHELGLKLTGISANSLTFEDERGGRYTRNF